MLGVDAATKRALEGFQLRTAYRMANKYVPKRSTRGEWEYPASADVLEEVGLRSVWHYIEVR